jgi:aldehyde:ferredoxin oxidoreductase
MAWHKRVLRVDLTSGEVHIEPIPQEWLDQYLGLRSLATRYLCDLMDPTADPWVRTTS